MPSASPHTAEVLARITAEAETLWERIARVGADAPPALPMETLAGHLQTWAKVGAQGDFTALLHRLSWDGVEPSVAATAVAAPRADGHVAGWTERLTRYAEVVASASVDGPSSVAGRELPFGVLWRSWADLGLEELRASAGASLDQLTEAAVSDAWAELAREVAWCSEAAAYELFDAQRTALGAEGAYGRFVAACLGDPITVLYDSYPVLARQTCRLVEQWRSRWQELLDRLEADRDPIRDHLGVSAERIASVSSGLSDRHRGGRQVVVLETKGGQRLVYKPRSLGAELGWAGLVQWCADEGLAVAPGAARALDRGAYGWMEHVEPEAFDAEAEAARYHRRAGSLAALTFALRAEDLHAENLIATLRGPVVIDAEMLLQPERERLSTGEESADGVSTGSCLTTGLLTKLLPNGGEDRALAGLRPTGQRTGACRVWHDLNGDAMRGEPGEEPLPEHGNAVVLGGEAVAPEAFADDLLAGFEETYRFLLDRRGDVLAGGGPIDRLAEAPVRVLFRASQEYGRVLQLAGLPRNQKSGLSAGWLQEAMLASFTEQPQKPVLWPVVLDEREALEAGDVPWFAVPAGELDLPSSHGGASAVVPGILAKSGIDAVSERIKALSEEDLERQLGLLRLALAPDAPSRALSAPLTAATAASPGDLDALSAVARALGDEVGAALLDGAAPDVTLGRGVLGSALFLAALERASGSGDRGWRAFVDEALAAAAGAELNVGGYSGWGGILWALVALAELSGDGDLLDEAEHLAPRVDAALEGDDAYDVERGAAGAILGLLALADATGQERHVEAAVRCGAHLLGRQLPVGTVGAGWPNPAGLVQTGWAHGNAGIARALAALGHRVGGAQALVAAVAALGYERSQFDAKRGNWPVLLTDSAGTRRVSSWMVAVCRGAPGVALARLYLPGVMRDGAVSAELRAALQTTATSPGAPLDHLCCGAMGRSSVLLSASLRNDPSSDAGGRLMIAAHETARAVLARAAEKGRFSVSADSYENRRVQTGLLHGVAGVGYQLLRLSGAQLPDFLALELPSERIGGGAGGSGT